MSRDDNFKFFTSFRGVTKQPKLTKGVHTSTTARPGLKSEPEIQLATPGIVSDGDKCIHPAKSKPKKRKPVNESEAADPVTLESILWSDEVYTAQQLASKFDGSFPIIIRVRQGYTDDFLHLVRGQVLQIHSYGRQWRVIGQDSNRRKFSIPLDYPMNIFVRGNAAGGEHWRFSAAMEVKRLPVSVKVTRVDESTNQTGGETLAGAELTLTSVKEAVFLRANSIKDGWIDQSRITLIPDFIDAQFSVAVGMCSASEQEWIDYHGMFARCVRHLKFFDLNGHNYVISRTAPEGEDDNNTINSNTHSHLQPSRNQRNGNPQTTNTKTSTARRNEKISYNSQEEPGSKEYELLKQRKYENVKLIEPVVESSSDQPGRHRPSITEENRTRTLDYVRKPKKDGESTSSDSRQNSQASAETTATGQFQEINSDNEVIESQEAVGKSSGAEQSTDISSINNHHSDRTGKLENNANNVGVLLRNRSINSEADSVANMIEIHRTQSVTTENDRVNFYRSQPVASDSASVENDPIIQRSESVTTEGDYDGGDMFEGVIELASYLSYETNDENQQSSGASVSEASTDVSIVDDSVISVQSRQSNDRNPNNIIINANNNRLSDKESRKTASDLQPKQRNERKSSQDSNKSSSRQSDSGIEPGSPIEINHASLFRTREKSVKQLANAFLNNPGNAENNMAETPKNLHVTRSKNNSTSEAEIPKVKITTQQSVISTKSDDVTVNAEENKHLTSHINSNNNKNKNPKALEKPPPNVKPSRDVMNPKLTPPSENQQIPLPQLKSPSKQTVVISQNLHSKPKPVTADKQNSENKSVAKPTIKISQSSEERPTSRPVVAISPSFDAAEISVKSAPAVSPNSGGKPKLLPPPKNTRNNNAAISTTSGVSASATPSGKKPASGAEVTTAKVPSPSATSSTATKGIQTVEDIPTELMGLGVNDVCSCLRLLDLKEFEREFERQQIDGARLSDLTESLLQSRFGFSAFNASKLMRFVRGWRP